MKPPTPFYKQVPALLLAMALAGAIAGLAAPPVEPPKSVFIIPTKPQDGRDPFFPDSIRPYEASVTHTVKAAPSITDLTIKSILVNQRGQAFAIINDQTFGTGDEGDVITSNGRRLNIKCNDINPAKGTVTISSGENTVTLMYLAR